MRQNVSCNKGEYFMGSNAKEKLKQAVLRLLEKKHFLDITVTDLVNEAGVARASFYRLFSSIDGVVDDVLADLEVGAENTLMPILLSGDEDTIKKGFTVLLEKIKNRSIPLLGLLPDNSQMIASKFALRSILANHNNDTTVEQKYLSMMTFGLLVSVARTWTYYGFKETASELADFLYGYIYEGKYRKAF